MSYRIAQDYEYAGNNYWRWWAWIDAGSAALDEVSEVVWILHPSFKRPRVATTDRSTRFRLETSGWGVFLLRAELLRKDGEKHELRHNLRLEFPGFDDSQSKEAARSSPSRRSIFLSYSTADSRAATKLRTALEREGVTVMDKMQVGPGDPWRAALYEMISRADAVFGLIGDDDISPWVKRRTGYGLHCREAYCRAHRLWRSDRFSHPTAERDPSGCFQR